MMRVAYKRIILGNTKVTHKNQNRLYNHVFPFHRSHFFSSLVHLLSLQPPCFVSVCCHLPAYTWRGLHLGAVGNILSVFSPRSSLSLLLRTFSSFSSDIALLLILLYFPLIPFFFFIGFFLLFFSLSFPSNAPSLSSDIARTENIRRFTYSYFPAFYSYLYCGFAYHFFLIVFSLFLRHFSSPSLFLLSPGHKIQATLLSLLTAFLFLFLYDSFVY